MTGVVIRVKCIIAEGCRHPRLYFEAGFKTTMLRSSLATTIYDDRGFNSPTTNQ